MPSLCIFFVNQLCFFVSQSAIWFLFGYILDFYLIGLSDARISGTMSMIGQIHIPFPALPTTTYNLAY
jgi:hypothetical protein